MKEKQNIFLRRIAMIMSLTAMLVMHMPFDVFAEGETIDQTKPVSLTMIKYEAKEGEGDGTTLDDTVTGKPQTVTGREPMAGVQFTVLKFADLVQRNTNGTVALAYRLTADGAAVLSKSGTAYTENQEVTITALKNFIAPKTARDAVFEDLESMTNAVTAETGDDGMVRFTSDTGVAASASVKHISGQGLYLVVETSAPDNVTKRTHPFFASLPMSDRVNLNQWQYDVYAYPKNSTGQIDFNKQISAVNGVTDRNAHNIAGDSHSAEAYIGDDITYRIPFTMAISSEGLTKLGIEDTMCEGLTFKTAGSAAASTDVVISRVDGTHTTVAPANYTVTAAKNPDNTTTLKIEFKSVYIDTLNADQDNRLPQFEVTYHAILNEKAVLGTTGNKNKAHAYYRSGDMAAGDADKTTTEIETTIFTWGVSLVKRGESNTALQNVEFTLTNDEGKTYKFDYIANGNNGYYVPSDGTGAAETLVTDSAGNLVIRGLKSDVYDLKETKTAAGYILLKDPVRIVINGDNTDGTGAATVNGANVTMTADPLNAGAGTALVPVTVVNSRGFVLPSTGGAGTVLITMTGIVTVVISSVLLIRINRKKRREASAE